MANASTGSPDWRDGLPSLGLLRVLTLAVCVEVGAVYSQSMLRVGSCQRDWRIGMGM